MSNEASSSRVEVMDPRESSLFSRWFECDYCERPEIESKFENDNWNCSVCGWNERGDELKEVYQCSECSMVAADRYFVRRRCDCLVNRD